jgi:hypothetical protein
MFIIQGLSLSSVCHVSYDGGPSCVGKVGIVHLI